MFDVDSARRDIQQEIYSRNVNIFNFYDIIIATLYILITLNSIEIKKIINLFDDCITIWVDLVAKPINIVKLFICSKLLAPKAVPATRM